jgi:hypothetical protein
MSIKQHVINQPWAHLTSSGLPVLFCNGLGQPIVPVLSRFLCDEWQNVPSRHDYLVLPGRAARFLLEENNDGEEGSKLGEKVEWIYDKVLIQKHTHHDHAVCHVQRLRSVSRFSLNKKKRRRMQPHVDSCFVFSNRKSGPRCTHPLSKV